MNGTPKRAAVVVAHPDDEIIWCGGLILQHPDWKWTVLSLSRADDPDRRPKFEAVCRRLGTIGLISTLDDGNPPAVIDCAREIGTRMEQLLPAGPWDLCVTHGPNGEYGHIRHAQIHTQVLELVRDGTLACEELWTFAYRCDAGSGRCRPAADADVLVELTAEQLCWKKGVIQADYGYGPDSFEVTACISPEAFRCWKVPAREMES